jgi:hypothetical protein
VNDRERLIAEVEYQQQEVDRIDEAMRHFPNEGGCALLWPVGLVVGAMIMVIERLYLVWFKYKLSTCKGD